MSRGFAADQNANRPSLFDSDIPGRLLTDYRGNPSATKSAHFKKIFVSEDSITQFNYVVALLILYENTIYICL